MPTPEERDQALERCRQAIEAAPGNATPRYQLANFLRELGRHEEAIERYREALALDPGLVAAYNNMGISLKDAGKLEEAMASFRRAIELNPRYRNAHNNLGSALLECNELEEALASCGKAYELDPSSTSALFNFANCCRANLKLEEALPLYERAIALAPENGVQHWNYAIALLMSGRYEQGWREYEWRWDGCPEAMGTKPKFTQPEWSGEDIAGKTILLHREQGLGDVIQFARYAPLVAARGAKVVIACQPEQVRLFTGMEGVSQAVGYRDKLPEFDLWCPLLKLPFLLRTTLATIPAKVPYLKADPALAEAWRKRIGAVAELKVGLIWGGKPGTRWQLKRSCNLATFAPLAQVKGVRFYSLQKGEPAAEAKSPPPGLALIDWTSEIRDFADTAALMANLDLVISVDTAGVHLAGALGKPVWLLNRYESEWRWLTGREDSPWYPTLRIFRQPRFGDWQSVAGNIATALKEAAGLKRAEFVLRHSVAGAPTGVLHANLAEVLKAQGRKQEAIAAYTRAVKLAPADSRMRMSLGNLYAEAGRIARAAVHFREAASLNPELASAHQNLGNSLVKLARHEQAIPVLKRALELKGDDVELLVALGSCHLSLEQFEQALPPIRKAIELNPQSDSAHFGLANTRLGLLDLERALPSFERAIALTPDTAKYHWNYAIALLLKGDYARGWKEYERRWEGASQSKGKPALPGPEWNGEDIRGKTILLYCEQGIGDEIQFIRYAPLVAERGARVIVRCHTPLARLLRTVPGIAQVCPGNTPLPRFDVHRATLSLPLVFGTTLETIPSRVPYLTPDKALSAAWRARMGKPSGLKVGLIWGGAVRNLADHKRSIPLSEFAPLAGITGVEFYSLQFGEHASQLKRPPAGLSMTDWTADIKDFADTAALLDNLDLLITVDTSGAHLAAALGKPVWLLNRYESEWRWLLEREDSPWYPTMRIFRQSARGDWKSVIEKIASELPRFAPGPQTASGQNPDDFPALMTRAADSLTRYDFRAAVAPLEKAISLKPASHVARFNLANAWLGLHELDRALPGFERALAMAPDNAQYHWNLAIALLLKGDYQRGWKEYEWRWSQATKLKSKPPFPGPEWDGEDMRGKTLLLYCEQGLGDAIQFIRYAPLVAKPGVRVVVRCHPPLARLFRSVPGIEVVSGKTPVPSYHRHRPLLSLPLVLGTTLDTIPARVPYLAPDKELAAAWSKRIGAEPGLKVGLVWGGRMGEEWQRSRTLDLAALAPLAKVKGVRFFSLQKGEQAAQAQSPPPGMNLIDWTHDIDDFADTAALMANLDLVISVDTASAHLAGALGKPVWLMLRQQSDWRYFLDRSDSPWYPTMRIFRQQRMGDWAPVAADVAKALAELAGKSSTPQPAAIDYARVEKSLRQALAKTPTATRHADLAEVLKRLDRNDEAVEAYQKAVKLDPKDTRFHMSLANLLVDLGKISSALPHYRKVIRLKPDLASAHNNLGSALGTLGRHREAIQCYERAIAIEPGAQEGEWNHTVALLQAADYARGWKKYDQWRWTSPGTPPRRYDAKPWRGERTAGGRLLLWGEQGIGDEIIYLSMLNDLAKTKLAVTLEIDHRLVAMAKRSFPFLTPVARTHPSRVSLDAFDWQCPTGSLGAFLRPNAKSFPRHGGFLLPDPARVDALAPRVRTPRAGRVVGLAWTSTNRNFGDRKNSTLEEWMKILSVKGVRFIDLQYGDTRAARQAVKARGVDIQHLDDVDLFNDLEGLAALCSACDLVITTSNVTAHMAGALGKPVWALLPAGRGRIWYWLANSSASPWYPSMRIFSQKKPGDWREPLAEVARELARFARPR